MSRAKNPKGRRSKSKAGSSYASGWIWLMLGLLLALFFGGAVRALLSERQVRQWIEKKWQKENPPYALSFDSARVELSEGWRPKFGLRVQNLKLVPHNQCGRGHRLEIQNLFLPGPIGVLWGKPLKFGHIKAVGIRLERLPACQAQVETEMPKSKTRDPFEASVQPLSAREQALEFFKVRWPKELTKTSQWLEGIRLENIHILGLAPHFQDVKFENFELSLREDGERALVQGVFGLQNTFGGAFAGAQMQLQLSATRDTLDGRLHVPVREGHITVHSTLNLMQLEHSGEFNVGFLPASAVLEVLKETRVVTDPLNLKHSWVAGEGRWQGELFKENQFKQVHVEHLKLSGDTGLVTVEGLELEPQSHSVKFEPFAIRFDRFSLRYLIEALGRKGYTGVVQDFGLLSGELQVTSAQDLSFRGELENMALIFSRNDVRTTQRINSLMAALELKNGRVSGLVRDFELEEGQLRGSISFNLDRDVLNGVFQAKVDELKFNANVEKVMLDGTMAPLALYGQGQIKEGQVQQWSGELGIKNIKGSDWAFETLKIRSEFANSQMVLLAKVTALQLNDGNSFVERLRPVIASRFPKLQAGDLRLQHLSSRFEISPQEIRWRNSSASTVQGEVILSSTGQSQQGAISGLLTLDFPTAKMVKWNIRGPWNELEFTPFGKDSR